MLSLNANKTAEEKADLKARGDLLAWSEKDSLGDDSELAIVAQVREAFSDQLQKRKEQGTDWDFMFGDIALTRVLRGNDGSLDGSKTWMTRMLKTMEEKNIDALVKSQLKRMEDAGWAELTVEMLPNPDMSKFVNLANISSKTQAGDNILYFPISDCKRRELAADEEVWAKYVETIMSMNIAFAMITDRQAKALGTMVKTVTIFDMADVPVSDAMNKQFDEKFDKDVAKVFESIFADQYKKIYLVNAVWWLSKLWGVVSKFLPARLLTKISITGESDDCAKVAQIANISEVVLRRLYNSRINVAGGAAGNSGEIDIKAGALFERTIEVKAGDTISWTFTVLPGGSALGASDLKFAGKAWWLGADVDASQLDSEGSEVVVPAAMVTADDGEVIGEIEVAYDGVLAITWDNCNNTLSKTSLKYQIEKA